MFARCKKQLGFAARSAGLLAAAVLAGFAGTSGALAQQQVVLGMPAVAPDAEANLPKVIRSRAMAIDTAPLAALVKGDRVVLNLFDDATFVAVLDELAYRGPGMYVWQGPIAGKPGARFMMSVWGDAVSVDVLLADGTNYGVRGVPFRPDIRGVFVVRQVDVGLLGRCGGAVPVLGENPDAPQDAPADQPPARRGVVQRPPVGPQAAPAQRDELPPQFSISQDPNTADLAVFWTPQAVSGAGGLSNLFALINGEVADTNTTMQASTQGGRNRAQVNWMAGYQLDYVESGNSGTDLSNFGSRNGIFNAVQDYRNRHAIDLMAMVAENGEGTVCGLGNVPGPGGPFSFAAFTWNKRSCLGNLGLGVLAHEIGHNFGMRHDRNNDNGSSPISPYAYGWRWDVVLGVAITYRDTMAYNPGTRFQIYSNPDISFPSANGTFVAAGSAGAADNARVMSDSMPGIVGFRARPNRVYMSFRDAPAGDGTVIFPFARMEQSLNGLPPGWVIWIDGTFRVNQNITINQPVTLAPWDGFGPVTIGTP